jgi:hypothetical protein
VDRAPFHLLVCDFDNGVAYVTGPVDDGAAWAGKVAGLRAGGRNVTCQPILPAAAAAHREAIERFCAQHHLRIIDRPPPGLHI